jgi:hypothetical protein
MAISFVGLLGQTTLSKAGKYFGMNSYSTVSSAVERVNLRMNDDRMEREFLAVIRLKPAKAKSRFDPLLLSPV